MRRPRPFIGMLLILFAVLAGGMGSVGLYRWEQAIRTTSLPPEAPPLTTATPSSAETTAASATSPPTGSTDASAGQLLFAQLCDACHPGGGAGLGPTLRGAGFEARFGDDAALAALVRDGTRGMPAFPETRIPNSQLPDLIAFLRTLRPVAAATPTEVPVLGEMTWTGSYAQDIQPIFDAYCARCHGGTLAENGLHLDSYEGVMGGTRSGSVVTRGLASGSTLVWVIQGLAAPQIRMPHTESPLSPNRIQNIVLWIDAGAPND